MQNNVITKRKTTRETQDVRPQERRENNAYWANNILVGELKT